eukprot:5100291-Ditylum_brightwellii.AAC.1
MENALNAFSNKQTMSKEQMSDNIDHCLNAMIVQVSPNKAYKLQKQVTELNNYLTESPAPARFKARKLEQEELLEVLENRIPTSWIFQIDKEGFNASSSTLKDFTKICAHYKELKPKITEKTNADYKSQEKCKAKCKADKKTFHKRGQAPPQCHSNGTGWQYCKYHGCCKNTMDECKITIN